MPPTAPLVSAHGRFSTVKMLSSAMTEKVVGRESELASIHAFLDRPTERAAGLVLEGSPGIGKSAWCKDPDGNTIALFQPE